MLRRTHLAGALAALGLAIPVASAVAAASALPAAVPPAARRAATAAPRALPAGDPFTAPAVNRAAARRWAARALADLRLPPGARRLSHRPAGLGRALRSPGFSIAGPELVDASAWWTVDAPPGRLVAYVRAHLPHRRPIVTHGVGGEPGRVTDGFWSYAPPPGLLQLSAAIQTDVLRGGLTAVRLDGEATWLVPRPSWDRIPASVRSVTYTARATVTAPSTGRPVRGRGSRPRTLPRGDAQRLARAIDRLQRQQPDTASSCPFDPVQARVILRFRGASGRPLALAVDAPGGCADLTLRVAGRRGPVLQERGVRRSITEQLVALGAIPACRTGELAAGPTSLAPAGRHSLLTLSLRNRSDSVCTVRGYPRIALLDAAGHPLVHRQRAIGAARLRRAGISGTVILYPGTSAQLSIRYADCAARAEAATAQIGLPQARTALGVPLRTARAVTPCPGAALLVNPLSAAL
ncbi:MAG TPA: DUF4232 domain-containing protein [Solirubrobacteraceae bacterium]|nr:DUF4232 domain-containing protein [Solirubrobacteraceae bacterium]